MSVKATAWAWSIDGVSATERLLLVSLADFAGPHGSDQHHCWPSQDLLATRSCVSARQVRTLLGRLEERGLVKRERRSTRDGRTSDRYWLPVWESQPEETSGSATGTPTSSNRKSSVEQPEVDFQGTVREPKENPHSPDDFDTWWAIYPKKVDKGAARKAWRAATRKAKPERIINALRAQQSALQQDKDRGYCKNPATWLNAESWGNETPTRPSSGGGITNQPRPEDYM